MESHRRAVFVYLLALPLGFSLIGCETDKANKKEKTAPAKLVHPDEGDIDKIVLTPKAEQRLQISTVPVQMRAVPRTRTVGGAIMIPDGRSVIVTAPVVGTLQNPTGTSRAVAGQKVTAQQPVFRLQPLLAPEREVPSAAERVSMADSKASLMSSQIIAAGDVQQSEAQVEAAQIALTRTRQLFNDKVGSQRDVDEAVARLDLAEEALKAAKARMKMLDQLTLDANSVQASEVAVRAPQNGILRNISSSVGQVVSAGAPLFEVVNLEAVWVRVPVYPGISAAVDAQRDAIVRKLGEAASEVRVAPVTAPPSADSLASSIDLFYELSNEDGLYFPGEGVEVVLPIKGESESLVVPRAAILRDIHGIAWVYVNSAEHEFRRHRVEVHFTTEELAILSEGPPVGTSVVVDGVAELFGTEFGAGK